MYQPTQPPKIGDSGLAVLSYDSGIKFLFKPSGLNQESKLDLAKIVIQKGVNFKEISMTVSV